MGKQLHPERQNEDDTRRIQQVIERKFKEMLIVFFVCNVCSYNKHTNKLISFVHASYSQSGFSQSLSFEFKPRHNSFFLSARRLFSYKFVKWCFPSNALTRCFILTEKLSLRTDLQKTFSIFFRFPAVYQLKWLDRMTAFLRIPVLPEACPQWTAQTSD